VNVASSCEMDATQSTSTRHRDQNQDEKFETFNRVQLINMETSETWPKHGSKTVNVLECITSRIARI